MNVDTETRTIGKFDGFKWFVVCLLVAGGVYGNAYFSTESILYRVVCLLILGVFASFLAFQTQKGKAFWNLVVEGKVEIRKVVWPSRQETVHTTIVVVIVVMVVGLILWALDSLLGWMVSSLIG